MEDITSNFDAHIKLEILGADILKELSSKELGEFYLTEATLEIPESAKAISPRMVFYLHLEGLYGFHILNSFIPSALMVLISYATLFFPMHDFNERVMTSLTSLLVLTALFTQTSNTSARTSYFKLLDIWFVAMIAFSFLIVMCNIILHCIWTDLENKRYHLLKNIENFGSGLESVTAAKRRCMNAIRYCFLSKIIFVVLFISFLAIFCSAAKGLI